MKLTLKTSLVMLALSPALSHAVTLDFRHELKADSNINAERVKISHAAESGWFGSIEAKVSEGTETKDNGYKTGNGHFSGNGSEFELGKKVGTSENTVFEPSVNIAMGDDFIDYRVNLKLTYNLSDNWWTAARWRPGIKVSEKPDVNNQNYNQFNWFHGYKNETFSIYGDLEYRFTNFAEYKGEHSSWLYNVVAAMPINKQWVPYTEIGYVPRYHATDDAKDEMEMRYRVGIRYIF